MKTNAKRMISRFIAVFIAVLTVVSSLPAMAFAASVSESTAADSISVNVTLADKGEIVMANETVSVIDLDGNGVFTVDEVLFAAHESAYKGGASAGYGSEMGDYGMYITSLWGDLSGSYGYWLNNASCWSIGDTVKENDYVVAFVYQNTTVWDPYSKFSKANYTALAEVSATLALEKAGYDENWNTVFSAHEGATIKVYDESFTELEATAYNVADDGEGFYSVAVNSVGVYTVVAYDNATPIVPAVCTLTVTENADVLFANEVETKIDAIGSVTFESKAAVEAARAAYDALTDGQKALVGNYALLIAAEEALLKLDDAIEAAKAVEEKIDAIGEVTVHSFDKIKAAREAYDALTDLQKGYVENANELTDAENKIAARYIEAAKADHKAIYEATGKYINALGKFSVGSEWLVIDLVRAGYPCPKGYYESVEEYVKANINEKQQIHGTKSSENSRMILALTAAGYDVTDVGGHNLLIGLTDMSYVKKQGVNGPIWALIAFDCRGYDIPENASSAQQVTREGLIAYILEKQLENGGWALSGENADPDIIGMAIQALAPYYNTSAEVKAAVDKAIDCLSSIQYDNGGFGSFDGNCSESCARVIVALTALGIDPETDARFVKNGVSVLDALCLYAIEEGGFEHIYQGGSDITATEQAQCALTAYFRMLNGKTPIYDMSDVEINKNNSDNSVAPAGDNGNNAICVILMLVALLGISAVAGINKRNKKTVK